MGRITCCAQFGVNTMSLSTFSFTLAGNGPVNTLDVRMHSRIDGLLAAVAALPSTEFCWTCVMKSWVRGARSHVAGGVGCGALLRVYVSVC